MFPAYRNESWRGGNGFREGRDLSDDAPSSSYHSFSRAHEYDGRRRGGNDDWEQIRRRRHEEEMKERAKEKKRRQKEENRRRDMSIYSIKMVSFRSDDDSDSDDSDIILEKAEQKSKRKKREEKEHKKRRHSREHHKKGKKRRRRRSSSSSYSSSSSSSSSEKSSSSSSSEIEFHSRPSIRDLLRLKEEKWSFMEKMDPRVPTTFFVVDSKGDKSNSFYESLYKGDVAKFQLSIHQVLEGSDVVNRLIFPDEKKPEKKMVRYFDEKVRKTWSENPERFWRHKETKPTLDVIPLSMEPLLESDLPAEERRNDDGCDPSVMEVDLQLRSQMINRMLAKDRKNVELWLEFLDVQDQLHLQQAEVGTRRSKRERLTDGSLLERKMAIITRALETNIDSVKLKIERVKIGCYLWEKEKLNREIADLEFYHVNDPEMWSGILDIIKNERRYKLGDQLSKMATCLRRLSRVMKGEVRTHKAMAGTEQFVASVIRRRIQLLMQSGYVEKAIATVQAVCEYNFCVPKLIASCNEEDKRKYFEAFWDSGIARIGDIGAKGWANSIALLKAKNFITDEDESRNEQEEYDKAERKLILSYQCENSKPAVETNRIWLEVEKMRAEWRWRPTRDVQNESCLDRYVTYEDIKDALFDFSERDISLQLILNILEDFGAVIFGKESTCPQNIMQQFMVLFPNISIRLRQFEQFIGRFFLQLASLQPQYHDQLLCSYITTAYAFVQRKEDAGNQKVTFKRFRDVAKSFFTTENKDTLCCVATFAEKFLEVGDKKKAIALSGLLKSRNNLWNLEDQSEMISCLRLALVFVHAVESDTEKCDALSSIVMQGTLPTADNTVIYEGQVVQMRLNLILTKVAAEKRSPSWDGSLIDLCATLTLLFVYYKARDVDRYRFLCSTYDSILNNFDPNRLLLFTKNFLDLISSYLVNHPNKSPRLLLEKLEDAARRFPTCVPILKQFIDRSHFGLNVIPLRRFLAEDIEDLDALRCRCYGAVYLELLRHAQLLALNDRHAPELRCVINVLRLAAERMHFDDDCFPRIALHIAKERGDKELIREVFYTARTNYPWSRALLIDFADSEPNQFVSLADTMVEKEIRLHCSNDEVGLLLY